MTGPYRNALGAEVLEAPTRDGIARLEVGPQHAKLEIGARIEVMFNSGYLTVTTRGERRRRPRRRSIRLDEHLVVVTRAVPTEDLALWCELRPGVVARVVGVRPLELLEAPALAAWKALDSLSTRLRVWLAEQRGFAVSGYELGKGQHRVVLVDYGSRMVLYARPIFRERPRRALEVHADGTVLIAARNHDQSIVCNSRTAVTVLGDRIRFEATNQRDIASLWLPWISPQDRTEISRRLGRLVHQGD